MEFVLAFVLIVGLSTLFTQFYFKHDRVVRRKLKKAPYIPISAFKNGQTAKIVGKTVFSGKPLFAPFSNRLCAYYKIIIKQEKSMGSNASTWDIIFEEESSSNYLVQDESGIAYVEEKNLQRHVMNDRNYKSGFLNDPSPKMLEFLKKKGIDRENFLGMNLSLRYFEGIIEEGEEIAVLGRGNWVSASELGLDEQLGQVLKITARSSDETYLSDNPSTTKKTSRNQEEEIFAKEILEGINLEETKEQIREEVKVETAEDMRMETEEPATDPEPTKNDNESRYRRSEGEDRYRR